MLLHRGEDERILKRFCMILDMERREGLYVITRGCGQPILMGKLDL